MNAILQGELDHLIIEHIAKFPGCTLADLTTGKILDKAGEIRPGRGDRVIHRTVQQMVHTGAIRSENRRYYLP